MREADYSAMTNDDFDAFLAGIVANLGPATLLSIPGVYEILAEEYNNEVLDMWATRYPDLAYPEGEEDD